MIFLSLYKQTYVKSKILKSPIFFTNFLDHFFIIVILIINNKKLFLRKTKQQLSKRTACHLHCFDALHPLPAPESVLRNFDSRRRTEQLSKWSSNNPGHLSSISLPRAVVKGFRQSHLMRSIYSKCQRPLMTTRDWQAKQDDVLRTEDLHSPKNCQPEMLANKLK